MDVNEIKNKLEAVKANISSVIIGQEKAINLLLITLVSRGHVLLEDVPGVGKTTLAQALAKSLSLDFNRIQFTPDVMPSDITGFNMYNPQSTQFEFQAGAVMTNLLLADEINRSSPKTQSALLEAMQERQVSVDAVSYDLPKPFMVVATQNSVEQVGTYPLPEAQLDRFMIKTHLRYPSVEEEQEIYRLHAGHSPLNDLNPVISLEDVLAIQEAAINVYLAPSVYEYIALISKASRNNENVKLGVSPRGALMLVRAAKGWALINGRDYVIPDDIKELAPYTLAHRLILHNEAELNSIDEYDVIEDILKEVPVPKQ